MELKVTQIDGVKFAVETRTHAILCDQPAELLLASLGSCAAFYAVQYLKTRNLADSGVEVSVTAEKMRQPGRLGNFRIQVVSPVALTEEQTEALMRSVHHCTVHNTLLAVAEPMANLSS